MTALSDSPTSSYLQSWPDALSPNRVPAVTVDFG